MGFACVMCHVDVFTAVKVTRWSWKYRQCFDTYMSLEPSKKIWKDKDCDFSCLNKIIILNPKPYTLTIWQKIGESFVPHLKTKNAVLLINKKVWHFFIDQ